MDFILRPWKVSDAKALARHLNNKKIWDNCRDGLPFPYTETDADAFIKYASEQVEQNEYCIEANHEAIGNIGFVRGRMSNASMQKSVTGFRKHTGTRALQQLL